MWCSQCKQDVPAVLAEPGRRVCPRCRGGLGVTTGGQPPVDTGIALDAFDAPATRLSGRRAPSVVDDADALARIRRTLRPMQREPLRVGQSPALTPTSPDPTPAVSFPLVTDACVDRAARRRGDAVRARRAWGASLAMALGLACLAGGVSVVAAHAAGRAPIDAWRWGLAAALAGEGLLVAGLSWMTARLWRNSRWLHQQLDLVEQQLAEIAAAADASRGRISSRVA